ncbi:MAG: glycosyltransferase family 4 protein [bacterium]|nr:glycosyltransferase family 4 protein [bacterium]
MLKLAIITNLYPPQILGGYEILCAQVCRHLRDRGHALAIITSDGGIDGAPSPPPEAGITRTLRLYLPFNRPGRLLRGARWRVGRANYAATRAWLQRERPDVVFVWSQLRLTLGPARAAHDLGLPVVYTFNDLHPASYVPVRWRWSPRGMAAWLLDHVLLRSITWRGLDLDRAQTTCISRIVKDDLLASGMPIAGSRVIYQGIEIENFPLKPAPGLIHLPARILYTGQLHAYKGVHRIIEAVNLLARRRPELVHSLTLVGTGPQAFVDELRALAAAGAVPVEFPGKVAHDTLPAIYRAHDVFVFASVREAFGLTFIEAMASGTPVISTATGGQGEVLRDGETALIFRTDDSHDLAAKLEYLLTQPDTARRIALAARQLVEHSLSLTPYVDQLEKFVTAQMRARP